MEKLVNLRYLYCYYEYPEQFFESMYKLRNLQTIVSLVSRGSNELPPEIWKMTKLRHVKLQCDVYLPDPPISEIKGVENSVVVLGNLQTLSRIYNFRLTEEVLERIPNLRKLGIHYDYIVVASWDISINNLGRLTKLESLTLWLTHTFPRFLVSITFPTSLKKLTLDGTKFYFNDYLKLHPDELKILVGTR
ncbi:Hypothetical predicted protein [Olea europaea subsp. europaea]|uniref:Disease resistance R13L4/SHOC-2-like LRR domain-containing protein n=1 Tax=Olea europaea subsp. europaea TaxID=158383 RepID=A0A8S0RA24_OLEEU|nr:Hypothetical predicted protein [Olea europaea subsp. europaea]